MPLIRVDAHDVLTVTGEGTVSLDGSGEQWTVHPDSPLHLALPGVYRLTEGVSATLVNKAAEVLAATLPRATAIVASARIIAEGRRKMALGDKAQYLAERLKSMPNNLERLFDEQLTRLDTIEGRGVAMVDTVKTFVDEAEAGVQAAADVVAQLTNGAPADPN